MSAYEWKGQFFVEDGFGLPHKNQIEVDAYTPPRDGYKVYNTDTKRVNVYTVGQGWEELALSSVVNGKVDLAGDTMTGALVLHADPSNPLEAATKQYVDGAVQIASGEAASELNDLDDVTLTSPVQDHFLIHDGTEFVNVLYDPATELSDLSDITVTTPAVDHFLVHNGTEFVNRILTTADISDYDPANELNDLDDVTLTTPATGHALLFDGTNFVNRAIVKSDVTDFSDGDYATAAQGALADGALQRTGGTVTGDLVLEAANGSFGKLDLLGTPVVLDGGSLTIEDSTFDVNRTTLNISAAGAAGIIFALEDSDGEITTDSTGMIQWGGGGGGLLAMPGAATMYYDAERLTLEKTDGAFITLGGGISTAPETAGNTLPTVINTNAPIVTTSVDIAANADEGTLTTKKYVDLVTPTELDDLSDVNTSTVAPTAGQALVWDDVDGEFKPADISVDTTNFVTIAGAGTQTITQNKTFDDANVKVNGGGNLSVSEGYLGVHTDADAIAFRLYQESDTVTVGRAEGKLELQSNTSNIALEASNDILLQAGSSAGMIIEMDSSDSNITVRDGNTFLLRYQDSLDRWTYHKPIYSSVGTQENSDRAYVIKSYVDANVGAKELNELNDVDVTSAADGHVLIHDTASFKNRALVKNDVSNFVETDYVHTFGDESIAGVKTFSDDVIISGNLTVDGTTTTVNSTEVTVADNTIVLNSGEVGAGVTSGTSGFEVDRGTEENTSILFDETDDLWKVGTSTALLEVATSYFESFTAADWTTVAGVSTLVVAQTTHKLPIRPIYRLTAFDGNREVGIVKEVDATTGDVSLITTGQPFAGAISVST